MRKDVKAGLQLAGLAAVFGLSLLAWRHGATHLRFWPAIATHRALWGAYVAAHPVRAPMCFLLIFAAAVAMSLPLGMWLTLLGGLLFGTAFGALLTVTGASIGAVIVFLLARGLLAPFFLARLGRRLARLRPGLERDGFSYLLALRLMPVFPFWLVNLAPAVIGMRLAPFAWATILGMIPATVVLSAVGAGLGAKLASGSLPSAAMLLQPDILLPLLGLAVLAVLPPICRLLRRRTNPKAAIF